MRKPLLPLTILGLLSGCLSSPSPPEYRPLEGTFPSSPSFENPPPSPSPTPSPPKPDPGLVDLPPWKVGDTWTYNVTRGALLGARVEFQIVRMVSFPTGPAFVVRRDIVLRDRPTEHHYSFEFVDARTYSVLNGTTGSTTYTYNPPDPRPRFLRNGTFSFNLTVSTVEEGEVVQRTTHYEGVVELWGRVRGVQTPAGTFDTVQFRVTLSSESQPPQSSFRWYSPKVLNDVVWMSSDGSERYDLISYTLARR